MKPALNTLETRASAAKQALKNNRPDQAREICRGIINENPSLSIAWMLLGDSCRLTGKLREAIAAYSRVTQIENRNAEAHRRLGNTLLQLGQPKEAINNLEVACYLAPKITQYEKELDSAYNYICEQAFENSQRDKNIRATCRQAVWLFCDIFNRQCEYQWSCKIFEGLLARYPNNFILNYKLAEAFTFDGDLQNAVKYYTKTIRLEPDFPEACAGLAQVYEVMGDTAKALEILSRFIKRKGDNPAVSLVYGKLCQQNGNYREGLSLVEKALRASGIDRTNTILLRFQAGKLSDSLEDYDKAFGHYTRGNQLKNSRFDRHQHHEEIETLISTFDRDKLDTLVHSNQTGDRQIFIVGMMRSGTSLTEQILASHPDVHAGGESRALPHAAKIFNQVYTSGSYSGKGPADQQKLLNELSSNYLDALATGNNTNLRITDKMMYNYLRLHLVELLLPKARIIHCTRNPVDTCLSCYVNNFAGEHGYTNNLEDLGFYHKEYQRLMKHWKTVIRNPFFELSYERLVSNPEETIHALLDFCGLEWNADCLQFFNNKRYVNTASYDQIRKPIYTQSVERWRNYEKHLEPLLKAL